MRSRPFPRRTRYNGVAKLHKALKLCPSASLREILKHTKVESSINKGDHPGTDIPTYQEPPQAHHPDPHPNKQGPLLPHPLRIGPGPYGIECRETGVAGVVGCASAGAGTLPRYRPHRKQSPPAYRVANGRELSGSVIDAEHVQRPLLPQSRYTLAENYRHPPDILTHELRPSDISPMGHNPFPSDYHRIDPYRRVGTQVHRQP